MSDISQFVTFQDANQVETNDSFEPLKPGKYYVAIEEVEVKDTKSGGKGMNIKFDVIGPEGTGRKLFDFINLAHPTSPKCVEIGQKQLASICKAIGMQVITNTNQMLTQKIGVVVAIDKDNPEQNRIKGYYNLAAEAAKPATPAPQAAPAAGASANPAKMPWE